MSALGNFKIDGIGNTHSDRYGTALATLLSGQRVRNTKVGTPVTSSDGQDAQLSNDDGSSNSSSNLLGGLDSETDVTLRITNDHNGLETGTLTGTGLLLDRLDLYPCTKNQHSILSIPILPRSTSEFANRNLSYLHNLILQLREEEVHDLVLLDRQGM